MAEAQGRWTRLRDPDVIVGFGVVVAILVHVAYFFPRTVDDAFISLRYAENLARGQGAIFNPGERVEGYSSPLWMLVQALGFVLRLEPLTFTKLVGVGCLVATAFGTRALAREVYGIAGWPAWLPAIVTAANAYLVNWTVLGLETPAHVALIVLTPLAVERAAESTPARRRRANAVAAVALILLGTCRPEAPLYVAIQLAAPFAFVRTRAEAAARARALWPAFVAAGAVLAGLLAVRLAYYGALFPNTYKVKGAHAAFAIDKVAALWKQGSIPLEGICFCGGVVLLPWFALARRRGAAPAASALACVWFTASVAVDWMPSMRHLLPVTVLAPVGWACLVGDLLEKKRTRAAQLVAAAMAALPVYLLSVDVRISPIEHRDRWVVKKTVAKWSDTWAAYRREEPPHVTAMDPYEMGQVAQTWAVLETSDAPVETSWYAGRDIGILGFGTGVRVFDTAGLVTSAVSDAEAWAVRGQVTDDLAREMMERRPIAGDVYDGWDAALGRAPDLMKGYRIRIGDAASPNAFVAIDRSPPSHEEVVRRYRAFAAKLPASYHLHTLYGEAVGAAVLRRIRIVEGAH